MSEQNAETDVIRDKGESKFRRQYDRAARRLASLSGASFTMTRPLVQPTPEPRNRPGATNDA